MFRLRKTQSNQNSFNHIRFPVNWFSYRQRLFFKFEVEEFGPFYAFNATSVRKDGLFVCPQKYPQAVHIKNVSLIDTRCFTIGTENLFALCRTPSAEQSDNGTNFVGVEEKFFFL